MATAILWKTLNFLDPNYTIIRSLSTTTATAGQPQSDSTSSSFTFSSDQNDGDDIYIKAANLRHPPVTILVTDEKDCYLGQSPSTPQVKEAAKIMIAIGIGHMTAVDIDDDFHLKEDDCLAKAYMEV